jgi:SSS family solute:Na+ symporter
LLVFDCFNSRLYEQEVVTTTITLAADNLLRLPVGAMDYLLIGISFVFVLGIGLPARSQISTSLDFFLSGRRLPA